MQPLLFTGCHTVSQAVTLLHKDLQGATNEIFSQNLSRDILSRAQAYFEIGFFFHFFFQSVTP